MSSLNKVMLIGNLGKDPEIRSLGNGKTVANFSIATSEKWTNKQDGSKQERTEWHRIVVFNEKLAEIVQKYLRKGAKVYIEGQIQTRKWNDNKGETHYSTEIVLPAFNGTIVMLGDPGGARQPGEDRDEAPTMSAGARANGSARGTPEYDDDILF